MTRSTSAVAACRSKASLSSRSACARRRSRSLAESCAIAPSSPRGLSRKGEILCKAPKGLNGQTAVVIVLAPPNWGIDALAKAASYSEYRSVDRTRRPLLWQAQAVVNRLWRGRFNMRRREFITLLGVAATAWPLAAKAQQPERMRRLGVLMSTDAYDPEGQARIAAFLDGLQRLGWTDGRNAQIDIRWPKGSVEARKYAAELVALGPDVILATGVYAGSMLQQETQTIPMVFVLVLDPVGAGFVASLARPGGNATGFSFSEYGVSGKWLELLKELAPSVTRAAVLRDATDPAGTGQWGAVQTVAPSLGVELTPIGVRDAGEIERGVAEFARSQNSGLIVTAGGPVIVHRERIIATAATHRLPTVYWNRMYVAGGGLISYGPETIDQYRRAAGYVDRILKGEKPADLPVQAPTKYELVINLKTAKALGLNVPTSLLARADEVIE
jgi:ABC-type uncharacterized transport system substrate-binding protein